MAAIGVMANGIKAHLIPFNLVEAQTPKALKPRERGRCQEVDPLLNVRMVTPRVKRQLTNPVYNVRRVLDESNESSECDRVGECNGVEYVILA